MEEGTSGGGVSVLVAIVACMSMTIFYVAILYSPTLIMRLPPSASFKSFMIRRFVCAGISSAVSLIACALILPIKDWEASHLFSAYGIHLDHIIVKDEWLPNLPAEMKFYWEAVVFPLSLTSLMYAGSLVRKFFKLWRSWMECRDHVIDLSFDSLKRVPQKFISSMLSVASNISAWRLYFVAPLTEELVFRACMIPLLLCGGFKPYTVILLSPIFFSLAHLNHLLESYMQRDCSLLKACMDAGFQLGYTVIFGSYASFLFIRTGHLTAPLITHIFCNFMSLPALFSRKTGMVSVGFIAGMVGFMYLLFPLTSPELYNDRTDNCKCWHRYCGWS